MTLKVGGRVFRVLNRVGIGSLCVVYRCRFARGGREAEGVLKVARDARANAFLVNEAAVLRHLHGADRAGAFAPFLPRVEASFAVDDGDADVADGGGPRQANALGVDDEIRSIDELYTLGEVRGHYPHGVDPRDAAWVWRRLLAVLGFVHEAGVVHGAVLPAHVLIEPRGHRLVLVGWCSATRGGDGDGGGPELITGGYGAWYRRHVEVSRAPAPGLDIGLGARCVIELLGGDPVRAEFPASVDPALQRYWRRCLEGGAGARALLRDFDRLIEVLWGPRRFREFRLPAKAIRGGKGA